MKGLPESERLLQMTGIEREFWGRTGVVLAGMDEVGRGPLAGPVVAACVVLPPSPLIQYINDSKQVSSKVREQLHDEIINAALGYGLGWVAPDIIDSINILQATKLAFCKAYEQMQLRATDVLVDAVKDLSIDANQHHYVRGDTLSYLIAAASIVAKVARDRYMVEQDALYPMYGFASNKGYGTREHREALLQYGPCDIHRQSFLRNILGELHDEQGA